MTKFLYYIAGGASKADLKNLGLAHLIDASLAVTSVTGFEDGSAGTLLSEDATSGYNPTTQTWQNRGKYWLGFHTDNPPLPHDLARADMIDGHKVKLEKDWEVTVPLARRFPMGTALPVALLIGVDGELITKPLPRFAALSAGADKIFDTLAMAEGSIQYTELFAIIAQALAVNYCVSVAELSVLEVITTSNIVTLAEALIDMPTLRDYGKAAEQKKRLADDNNLNAGNQA